jgi:hypothetical protein
VNSEKKTAKWGIRLILKKVATQLRACPIAISSNQFVPNQQIQSKGE